MNGSDVRIRVLLFLCLATSISYAAKLSNSTGVWSHFRANPLATGTVETDLPEKLDVLWKYKVKGGAFETTPVIVEGIAFVPDLDGFWHAIDVRTGELKWKKKTNAFAFAAAPAFKEGRMFLGDIDGFFYCYDMEGKQLWKFESNAEINSSASFYDGKVLFGSQDATLYCLDEKTGALAWKLTVQDQIRCSPTVVDDRSFVAGCDGNLHIIDLKKGEEVAAVEIDAPTGCTPAVVGDHVFFGTEAGEVFKVDWKQAKVAWRFTEKSRREIRSDAAVSEKMLVIGSRSKNVYGLDPETGDEKWKFTCKRGVECSPLIGGDRVFVASTDGRAYLLDLMTGKQLAVRETGDSFAGAPALVDGKLIIASGDGVVYCFGTAKNPG